MEIKDFLKYFDIVRCCTVHSNYYYNSIMSNSEKDASHSTVYVEMKVTKKTHVYVSAN